MATNSTLGAQARRTVLLASLERDGEIQLERAAGELGVSSMTLRRDLDELAAEGLLRRVRGGAVAALGARPFRERREVQARAKSVIADKTLALVPTSGAIALDASTTAGTIGSRLGQRPGLTVATNSYENFIVARRAPGVAVVLIGGEAEEKTDSFVGLIACRAAESMLYKRFFASASAVDSTHGTSEVSLPESQVKHSFASVARETVLCIDSSKLGQQSVALGFSLREIAIMVTDLDPRDSRLDEYRDLVELR